VSEFSSRTTAPAGLPVLSRGRHRDPSRGACFMEYTALLAGEPFSDAPGCVDEELAVVLRSANDRLPDADRSHLVPLLGRAIGLRAGPPAERVWCRPLSGRRSRRERLRRHEAATRQLRCAVSRRFLAAVGAAPTPATRLLSGGGEEVAWLFWDLMDEPTRPRTSAEYTRRLVDRLALLHECYEQAMTELEHPRALPTAPRLRDLERLRPA